MSSDGRPAVPSKNSASNQNIRNASSQIPPGMYPVPYGPWGTPQAMPPGPWMNSWPGCNFPNQPQQWPTTVGNQNISPSRKPENEYTVDAMRRIYNNTDSSIEIERVKFQSKQPMNVNQRALMVAPPMMPFPGFQQNLRPQMSNALVPITNAHLPAARRPPPRKHRKNKPISETAIPQPFYQHSYPPPPMGYMPYPYPLPYFPYTWYPPNWSSPEPETSKTSTPDIFRNETRTPLSIQDSSSEQSRPLSPIASSQVSQYAESQTTDIAPSDSVSAGGYQKGIKNDNIPEWMQEMQKHLSNLDDTSEVGEQSSFTTAPPDTPTPPTRKNKLKENKPPQNNDNKTNLVVTDKTGADLNYAFKKLEKSVDVFKNQVEEKISDIMKEEDVPIILPSTIAELEKQKEIDRRSSSASYHSFRNTPIDDIILADSDLTDKLLINDKPTSDEQGNEEGSSKTNILLNREEMVVSPPIVDDDDDPLPGEGRKWVLQKKGEAPDVSIQQGTNIWLTDVSLWRARLVVSLDKGQGLDHQDWATFHLLIQHPLPLHLKLSLLHAPRICASNPNIGAVQVRTALLQIARHAQVLLQAEDERASGWKTITAHKGQPWMPVKGGIEILRILGYRERDDGTLKYSRRMGLDVSHLARLTLDLLLFADELRLYLTGQHPHPTNISDLFCPITSSNPVSPEPTRNYQNNSNVSSSDFLSAETTPILDRRHINMPDSVSQIDTDGTVHSGKVDYNKQLLDHHSSSSEDITLHEDDNIKHSQNPNTKETLSTPEQNNRISSPGSERFSIGTDITSLPDLQSMSSLPPSRLSNTKQSDFSEFSSPATSPLPEKDVNKYPSASRREDHIYEEIGDIKKQVQKLRSSVSVPNLPPPLPPKFRSSNMDDDSSTDYSRSDWSTTSMGGSTGRRRKKRRAPLPPSFLYEEQIRENAEINDLPNSAKVEIQNNDNKEKSDKKNPFYEEIGENRPTLTKQDSSKANPFYETKPKPSGFIGSNPFYEDVKSLKKPLSTTEENNFKRQSISEEKTNNDVSLELSMDQYDEDSVAMSATRPKRKAPKPPEISIKQSDLEPNEIKTPQENSTNIYNEIEEKAIEVNGTPNYHQSEETTQNLNKIPAESELVDIDLNSSSDEIVAKDQKRNVKEIESYISKNVNQKQLLSSQDVVSANENETGSFEIQIDLDSLSHVESNKIKNESKINNESLDNGINHKIEIKENAFRLDELQNIKLNALHTVTGDCDQIGDTLPENKHESVTVIPDAEKKLGLGEDPKLNETENSKADDSVTNCGVKGSHNSEEERVSARSSLHISEEIPYIDTSDSSTYKYSKVNFNSKNSSEIKIPHIQILKNIIPFMDDESAEAPPPPFESPPQTPPNTPPNDAPETPHISPPLTPPPLARPDSDISSFTDALQNRLSMISETTEGEDYKNSEQYYRKYPLMFNSSENVNRSNQRVSSVYYEIPEAPETPPPLPAKPNNLKSSLSLQRTPELPPKSKKIISQMPPKPTHDETRYEIPDILKPIPNQASPNDFADDLSISFASTMETSVDESSNPLRPPRKRRTTSKQSNSPPPPLPRKTFAGQFHGLRPQSTQSNPNSLPTTPTIPAHAVTLPRKVSAPMERPRPARLQNTSSTTSMPSSPRPKQSKKFQQVLPDKSRKSWPFLFCDCIDSNYSRNYTKK